jgi:GT2 family glycosyltransferase
MPSLFAAVQWTPGTSTTRLLAALSDVPEVAAVLVLAAPEAELPAGRYEVLRTAAPRSRDAVAEVLERFRESQAADLAWFLSQHVGVHAAGLRRLSAAAADAGAALAYSDYLDRLAEGKLAAHPLVDYQLGSLRDDFDFGKLVLLRGEKVREVAEAFRGGDAGQHGGWYDLRLRLCEVGAALRLPEPTYESLVVESAAGDSHFQYVDPRNRDYQIEMERVATAHLRRIGAWGPPPNLPPVADAAPFGVEASVVIPVRNRRRTIADAVKSALAQQTSFPFNVIVVDNHSDDGTTDILAEIAARDPRLVHLVPERTDLGIGGCWNEAVFSSHCGRYAVQLDSDDLYDGSTVLERIVACFRREGCAMVVGSYTIVNFDLKPIPPGLIDHREWTEENGRNNALRIAGLGAPRAFHVPTLRTIGFPNVSYGEDYAVALRMSRSYRIGRIYESLYWCRRWEDNTDHELPLEARNRYAVYKDRIRSIEIASRLG